jgi:hypothetical protein
MEFKFRAQAARFIRSNKPCFLHHFGRGTPRIRGAILRISSPPLKLWRILLYPRYSSRPALLRVSLLVKSIATLRQHVGTKGSTLLREPS